MDNYHIRFGSNVRALRVAAGLSQEKLAEHTGLHRTYISGVERGVRNPTLTIIVQIAHALTVEPAHLLARGIDAA